MIKHFLVIFYRTNFGILFLLVWFLFYLPPLILFIFSPMTDITPYLEEKLIKVLKMQTNLPKYLHYFTELKNKRCKRKLYLSATGCVDEIKKIQHIHLPTFTFFCDSVASSCLLQIRFCLNMLMLNKEIGL